MPVPKDLFSVDDPFEFRRWCRFQLYDMPRPTQGKVIVALRTIITTDLQMRPLILAAMRVNLPGVGLDYNASHGMQIPISQSQFLLVFRFYTGDPSALAPARLFQMGHTQEEMVRIVRGAMDANERVHNGQPRFLPRTKDHDALGRPSPPGRLPTSSYRTTPAMLSRELTIKPSDLNNTVGQCEADARVFQLIGARTDWSPQRKAEAWVAYRHQTGRRDMSPFLSCTAVMPRMVRSGSQVLRHDVIPLAPYLGIFLVPRTNFMVDWIHLRDSELDSIIYSVQEVEVIFRPLPPMQMFQLVRFRNPFCSQNDRTPIPDPLRGETATTQLTSTADPGFAADGMPGLVYLPTRNLLQLD
jgi:hypothetical protein